jgi:hypothetical protein
VVPLMKEAQKCGRRRKRGRRQTEVDGKTKWKLAVSRIGKTIEKGIVPFFGESILGHFLNFLHFPGLVLQHHSFGGLPSTYGMDGWVGLTSLLTLSPFGTQNFFIRCPLHWRDGISVNPARGRKALPVSSNRSKPISGIGSLAFPPPPAPMSLLLWVGIFLQCLLVPSPFLANLRPTLPPLLIPQRRQNFYSPN